MPIAMINGFKRDFKLYECDDCSECPLKHNAKTIQNDRKNYNWEYFKAQINKSFQNQKKPSTVKEKLMWGACFGFMKPFWLTRMSVRGINKTKN